MKLVRGLVCLLALAAIAGCAGGHISGAAHPLTMPELKYRLIDQVGRPLYCGPPVVRQPTPAEARQEVAALKQSDQAEYSVIIARLHLDPAQLSAEDNLRILQQAETLRAITLQAKGNSYAFDYVASRSTPEHVSGTIDATGGIDLARHDSVSFPGPGGCPICLAATTRIATPDGSTMVTDLRPGMKVWTMDANGRRVAVAVLRVGHTPAPIGHKVVRLRLDDGRGVDVSPGHPTVDGRTVGVLRVGDRFDGSVVASAELLAYTGDTWDLLPAGPTHAYWANGILLGSTLAD